MVDPSSMDTSTKLATRPSRPLSRVLGTDPMSMLPVSKPALFVDPGVYRLSRRKGRREGEPEIGFGYGIYTCSDLVILAFYTFLYT
jgi:hypothetical protein